MRKFIFKTEERTFDVFLYTEDLDLGQCVVIGSKVYQVRSMTTTDEGILCEAKLISNKTHVGMLSEW